jgi:hypothetical protein
VGNICLSQFISNFYDPALSDLVRGYCAMSLHALARCALPLIKADTLGGKADPGNAADWRGLNLL